MLLIISDLHFVDETVGKHNLPAKAYSNVLESLNIEERFQERRIKMLSDKIDYAAFLTWFIKNHPKSVEIMKENPDFQYRFK